MTQYNTQILIKNGSMGVQISTRLEWCLSQQLSPSPSPKHKKTPHCWHCDDILELHILQARLNSFCLPSSSLILATNMGECWPGWYTLKILSNNSKILARTSYATL